MIEKYVLIFLLIWNIIVMFLYGIDKLLAKAHKRRISEAALIASAFIMGGLGGIFGMVVFNHKTSKMKFRILVPFSIIIQITMFYLGSLYNLI